MKIDASVLARSQFAFTVSFHIIFPTISIGLASFLAIMEGLWLKTKNGIYLQIYKFWLNIFALAYLFAEKFGRPGKGNDKGAVENLIGFARRNFMVPIPHAASWEELNAHFEADCRVRRQRRLRGHAETIGERFERDRVTMLPLPLAPYEACEKVTARVSSLSLVRYRTNDYSVPTQYVYRQVLVKGHVDRVEIGCGSQIIGRHGRSYERQAAVYDPLHYLALLERKSRALDQAAPLAGWQLPECFAFLRRLLEARLRRPGRPGVHPGAAPAGELRSPGGHRRHKRRPAVEDGQLRCGAASSALPHRAQTTKAGFG
jgi:hypothetical protein